MNLAKITKQSIVAIIFLDIVYIGFIDKKIRNDYNSGIVLKRWRNDEEKRGKFRKAER